MCACVFIYTVHINKHVTLTHIYITKIKFCNRLVAISQFDSPNFCFSMSN